MGWAGLFLPYRGATSRHRRLEPTPLCGPKIVAILESGISLIAFLVYSAARLMPRPLGGGHHCLLAKKPFDLYHMQCHPVPRYSRQLGAQR
jgi:hypothetical protein